MSSVIRDAGEKDNKTCLSTTDNGPFFIIKKYAILHAAHFWPLWVSLDDPAGNDSTIIYFQSPPLKIQIICRIKRACRNNPVGWRLPAAGARSGSFLLICPY